MKLSNLITFVIALLVGCFALAQTPQQSIQTYVMDSQNLLNSINSLPLMEQMRAYQALLGIQTTPAPANSLTSPASTMLNDIGDSLTALDSQEQSDIAALTEQIAQLKQQIAQLTPVVPVTSGTPALPTNKQNVVKCSAVGVTTIDCTLPNPVVAGDLIGFSVWQYASGTITISDGATQAFPCAALSNGGQGNTYVGVYYLPSVEAGSHTVSITGNSYFVVTAFEVSGVSACDHGSVAGATWDSQAGDMVGQSYTPASTTAEFVAITSGVNCPTTVQAPYATVATFFDAPNFPNETDFVITSSTSQPQWASTCGMQTTLEAIAGFK